MFDIDTESEFERRLLTDVIPPNELNVSFEDIGALDHVKEALRELVMLPLQRPELFRKGNLTKPTKVLNTIIILFFFLVYYSSFSLLFII